MAVPEKTQTLKNAVLYFLLHSRSDQKTKLELQFMASFSSL